MDTVTEPLRAEDPAIRGLLDKLRERIGPQKFNAWFRHGTHMHLDNGTLRIAVPNPFVANWIETHYQAEIAAILAEQTGCDKSITVTIDPTLCAELRRGDLDSQADLVTKSTEGRARRRRPAIAPQLRHKLETFVVGETNKLAYSAACAVAGDSKALFTPLFIHGPCHYIKPMQCPITNNLSLLA